MSFDAEVGRRTHFGDLDPASPNILAQTGRLPLFPGGNADVIVEMLESAAFALLLISRADRE